MVWFSKFFPVCNYEKNFEKKNWFLWKNQFRSNFQIFCKVHSCDYFSIWKCNSWRIKCDHMVQWNQIISLQKKGKCVIKHPVHTYRVCGLEVTFSKFLEKIEKQNNFFIKYMLLFSSCFLIKISLQSQQFEICSSPLKSESFLLFLKIEHVIHVM